MMALSMILLTFFWLSLSITTVSAFSAVTPTTTTTLSVCQNKHCCKHFTSDALDLVQTLRQLAPPSCTVEASSCLSHCDEGPNVKVVQHDSSEHVEQQVYNAASAAAMLELLFEEDLAHSDAPFYRVHPTLLAACNVMERAHKATTLKEKERFLNSCIKALEKEDDLALSKTMAHALVMRAQARLDPSLAREDAIRAAELDPQHPRVWRVLADASPQDPTNALEAWAHHQPQFATKVKKELALYQQQGGGKNVSA